MKNIGIWLDEEGARVVSVENGLDNITVVEKDHDNGFFNVLKNQFYTAGAAVIIGPPGIKDEFAKEVKADSKLSFKLKGVETTEPMTDMQLTDWVKDFYTSKV